MSAPRNPLVERYLAQLRSALEAMPVAGAEREEILREIESHVAESVARGAAVHEALERLGCPEDLAHGYGMEMLLHPRQGAGMASRRLLPVTVLQAAAVAAVALLAVVMSAVGLSLFLGGALFVLLGILGPFIPSEWISPTLRAGLPQLVVLILGAVVLLVGVYSLRLVSMNLRFLVKALWSSIWSTR